jgi:hypothetical protein
MNPRMHSSVMQSKGSLATATASHLPLQVQPEKPLLLHNTRKQKHNL